MEFSEAAAVKGGAAIAALPWRLLAVARYPRRLVRVLTARC